MTFLIYALIILWIPFCATALTFCFRPVPHWPPFATRLRSFLMLLALFFGIPVFIALAAPDSMRVKPGEENKPEPVAAAPAPASEPAAPAAAPVDDSADVAKHPTRYLELSGAEASKGKGETVLLSGTIFNGASLAVRNPKLKCYLSKGPNDAGTVSGTVRRTIPAGEEIAFKDLDMGDSDGAWNHQVCEIAGAEAVRKKG